MPSVLIQRSIRRVIQSSLPPGVLSAEEVSQLAIEVNQSMDNAPWYVRWIFKMFYGFFGVGLNPTGTINWLRSYTIRGGMWRRLTRIMGNIMSRKVHLVIFSHPKVQRTLGIEEGASLADGTDPRPYPDPPPTLSFEELSDSSQNHDVIVIGSGPGGSMAAMRFAEAGYSVMVLEQGKCPSPKIDTFNKATDSYYGLGGWTGAIAKGVRFIPILFGRNIGGSSVVGGGAWVWPTEKLISQLAPSENEKEELLKHADLVSKLYGAAPADQELAGLQNRSMEKGCAKVGLPRIPITRNAINRGGVATTRAGGFGALKLSADRTALNQAVRLGAKVLSGCVVKKVLLSHDGVAKGVEVKDVKRKVRIAANKLVIVSGGAIGTPLLLRWSGLKNRFIGKAPFFQHYSFPIAEMPEDVNFYKGIESSIMTRVLPDTGIILEADSLPIGLVSYIMNGFGIKHWEQMEKIRRYFVISCIVSGHTSELTVGGSNNFPIMRAKISEKDRERMKLGLKTSSRIMFAAGAKRVLIPKFGWFQNFDQLEEGLEQLPYQEIEISTVHPLGTCPMARSPEQGAVDPNGLVFGTKNLYVMDGSILPAGPEANPTYIISTLVSKLSSQLASQCAS